MKEDLFFLTAWALVLTYGDSFSIVECFCTVCSKFNLNIVISLYVIAR